MVLPKQFIIEDDGIFPNSKLPVLFYQQVLELPYVMPAEAIKDLFMQNGWGNNWRAGIFTYHHYHSITHEVLGVIYGKTRLQLGGEQGVQLEIKMGDVIIIPAGVAHKNLGEEDDVICVGGYPDGREYDIKYGHTHERPGTDRNIAGVPLPGTDPVTGSTEGVPRIWKS